MAKYTIYGSENSPYSLKVRSYAEFKRLAHEWRLRSQNDEEYQKVAKIPIVPAVKLPSGDGLQDSTPIMEYFDKEHPNSPSSHPEDPSLKFISYLLEVFCTHSIFFFVSITNETLHAYGKPLLQTLNQTTSTHAYTGVWRRVCQQVDVSLQMGKAN